MLNFYKQNNKGYTLVEILFSIAIILVLLGAVVTFQSGIFTFDRVLQTGFANQQEAKKIINPLANEIRGAINSALGAYPIELATEYSFTFYTDIDGDDLAERIRYYYDDGKLVKSFISPDPDTYQYYEEEEEIIRVIHDVLENPIFTYYDSNYDGTASSTPLEAPVTPSEIRMIKFELEVDTDPDNPPPPLYLTTQVSLRNLKDNND